MVLRMHGEGRDGRGNLRENREDDTRPCSRHCDPHRTPRPPIAAAFMRVLCHPAYPMSPWF